MSVAALSLLACFICFYDLGAYRSLGSHEVFTAVPAREMLETGEWVVPTYGGVYRLRKPPLAYWVIAGSGALFGGVTEWTARLPSALSALGLVVLTGVWAGRWYGRTAGFCTALVTTTSTFVVFYGRKSEADMLLTLLIVAALFLVAEFRPEHSRRSRHGRWFAIYVLLGLTWLTKFHFGAAMVLGPAVGFMLVRRWYRSLWQLFNPLGLAVFAACVVVWPLLVLQRVPEAADIWQNETVGRALGTLGREPIWTYVPVIVAFTLPWTGAALAAIPASWRKAVKESDPHEQFLWVWLVMQLAVLCISASKHSNYILPVLPVFAIWSGRTLANFWERLRGGERLLTRRAARGLSLAVLIAAVGGSVVTRFAWPFLDTSVPAVIALASAGVVLGTWATYWIRPRMLLAGGAVTAVACFAILQGRILPQLDHRMPSVRFCRDIRRSIVPDEPVVVYRQTAAHSGLSPLVFYLEKPVQRVESQEELADCIRSKDRVLAVVYRRDLDELRSWTHLEVLTKVEDLPGHAPHRSPDVVLVELKQKPRQQVPVIATREESGVSD